MLICILLGNRKICRVKSSKDMWVLNDKVVIIGLIGFNMMRRGWGVYIG